MGNQLRDEAESMAFTGQLQAGEANVTFVESLQKDHKRWSVAGRERNWLILIIIGIFWAVWVVVTFLFEPGIR